MIPLSLKRKYFLPKQYYYNKKTYYFPCSLRDHRNLYDT